MLLQLTGPDWAAHDSINTMGTRDTHSDKSVHDLIAELMLLGADRRIPAAGVIEALLGQGYSLRKIARETRIPRTTLTRWAEATA